MSKKKRVRPSVLWFLVAAVALPLLVWGTYQKTQYRPHAADAIPWQPAAAAQLKNVVPSPQPILEVHLHYDAAKTPVLAIPSAVVKTGYASTPPYQGKDYFLQLRDQNNRILLSHAFIVPKDIPGPPPLEGERSVADEVRLETPMRLVVVDFALTVAWDPSANEVLVTDTAGAVVTRYQLPARDGRAPEVVRAPQFFTVSGRELSNEFNPAETRSLSAPGDDVLDITFIGDDYAAGDLGTFHADVNRFVEYLVTYEPFLSRRSQLRFSYVDNIADLACRFIDRLIICDYLAATQAVNDAGAPNEKVVLIYNNAVYGGSGGYIATTYNGSLSSQVFVHEFGHSLGYLVDEYLLNYPYARTDRNCYTGAPPNPLWQNVVPAPRYFLECNMPSWYRSSSDSIMRSIGATYFNAVSQKYLNEAFDYYASPIILPSPVPTPTPTPTPLPVVPEPIVNNFTVQAILHHVDGTETVFPSVNAMGIIRFEDGAGRPLKTRVNWAKCMSGGGLSLPIVSDGEPCSGFAPGRYATKWKKTVKINRQEYKLLWPTTCTATVCEQSEMITGGQPIHRGVYQAPAPQPTKTPKATKTPKGK